MSAEFINFDYIDNTAGILLYKVEELLSFK